MAQGGSADLRRAAPLLQQGMSAEAVAKAIGVSPRKAYRLKRQARELGWIAEDLTTDQTGRITRGASRA
jgi:transposase